MFYNKTWQINIYCCLLYTIKGERALIGYLFSFYNNMEKNIIILYDKLSYPQKFRNRDMLSLIFHGNNRTTEIERKEVLIWQSFLYA